MLNYVNKKINTRNCLIVYKQIDLQYTSWNTQNGVLNSCTYNSLNIWNYVSLEVEIVWSFKAENLRHHFNGFS